jgi:hypothetical protein
MAHSSWGQGWPNCNRSNIVTVVRADGLRLPVHRELAPLVTLLLDVTEAMGYDVRPDWTWGYACRAIAGTNVPSNHSWGTAVDINAPANPRRRPLTTNIPRAVRGLWKGHGFRWGGDFTTSVPDPMHFEFMGSVAEARATYARLRRFLGAVPPSPAPSPQPTAPGERGRIMELQRLLRVTADGVVGPATEGAMRRNMIGWRRDLPGNRNPNLVMWLQRQGRRKGYALKVDGQVGPEVNHLIVVVLGQRDGICGPNGYRAACR